jgi:hypothetical protein
VILASPRKAVEQSTGRILRTRASERVVAPLIVDIVDSHGMYMSMWKKRAAYYKKCAYKIEIVGMGTAAAAPASAPEEDAESDDQRKPNEFGCLLED